MKPPKSVYVCNECGEEYAKWQGRCHSCGAWDSVTELRLPAEGRRGGGRKNVAEQKPVVAALADSRPETVKRFAALFSDVNVVLGGGLVPGSVVLIGGDPGIGKSTLLLQLVAQWSSQSINTLYVSGEESLDQVSLRASRLGVQKSSALFLAETCVETILSVLAERKPQIAVIDSIQTIFSEQLQSAPGNVAQVRESAALLSRYAKETSTSIFLIGHVTKDGSLAGPRVLEHMVDTVLYFEGDASYQYRIVRVVKNRFGPSGEIAIFSMSDSGLAQVDNASELFLGSAHNPQTGSAVVPVLEGRRVLAVELQALVNRTHFGLPQRVASGINPKKLSLLVAVLERHGGLMLGDHDIFFNVAGGLSVAEPAADLGVAAALLSSFRGKPITIKTAFIGEIGLSGEIRPVNHMIQRLKELQKLGFSRCITPKPGAKSDWAVAYGGLKLDICDNIAKLGEMIF